MLCVDGVTLASNFLLLFEESSISSPLRTCDILRKLAHLTFAFIGERSSTLPRSINIF